MSTYIQAKALQDDLAKAEGNISWQIGKVANVLLARAKKEKPDNIALAQLDPFEPAHNGTYIANVSAGDVRAIVGQIVTATKPSRSISVA